MTALRSFFRAPAAALAGAALVAVPLAVSGCDAYLDINEDPNNPTSVPVDALLATSTFRTGGVYYGLGSTTSNYVQYLASPNQASDSDVYERLSLDGTWGEIYEIMADLSAIEAQGAETGATAYVGIAKILKALHLAAAVDVWGDVPYSTALNPDETLNPTYDDAAGLYGEVLSLLDDGIAALQGGGGTVEPGADDFIHGGDLDRWVQTGYALRARTLNHYSETAQYDPAAVLAAVDRSFTSNADDAAVAYFTEQINPWANLAIRNAGLILGGWLSEQTVQALDGTTTGVFDPRIEAYTDSLAPVENRPYNGPWVGTPNGAGRGGAGESRERNVLTTNTYFAARTAPIELITYAEVKMIEAEAALRLNNRGRAYAAYLEAIRAHMDKLGVSGDAAEAYVGSAAIGVGAAALSLDDVFREKYKIMFLNPEAWVDARRFDYAYEDFDLPANALLSDFIRRLDYPDTEYTRNQANIPAGGNNLTGRIFWDQ